MGAHIGVIGMAVMGQNLALNMESRGYTVGVYNRTAEKTRELVEGPGKGKRLVPAWSIEELISRLSKPAYAPDHGAGGKPRGRGHRPCWRLSFRRGDIIIDGGNSFFQDTIRRAKDVEAKGSCSSAPGSPAERRAPCTVPASCPGGIRAAYDSVGKILRDISAKVDGEPCCAYIGPDGAGHYVKMVHNGIEYGDMQLISEAYFIMKNLLGHGLPGDGRVFARWNQGDLDSFLIQITADILAKKDPETGAADGGADPGQGRPEGHGQVDHPVGP